MTNPSASTLFDRLVARTLQPPRDIEAPSEPLFERFEEPATETTAPRLAAPLSALPSPSTDELVRPREIAPAAGRSEDTPRQALAQMEPLVDRRHREQRRAEEPKAVARVATSAAKEREPERTRTARETRTAFETRFRDRYVPVLLPGNIRERLVERSVRTATGQSPSVPEIQPDLPPVISFLRTEQGNAPTVPGTEPAIHVDHRATRNSRGRKAGSTSAGAAKFQGAIA